MIERIIYAINSDGTGLIIPDVNIKLSVNKDGKLVGTYDNKNYPVTTVDNLFNVENESRRAKKEKVLDFDEQLIKSGQIVVGGEIVSVYAVVEGPEGTSRKAFGSIDELKKALNDPSAKIVCEASPYAAYTINPNAVDFIASDCRDYKNGFVPVTIVDTTSEDKIPGFLQWKGNPFNRTFIETHGIPLSLMDALVDYPAEIGKLSSETFALYQDDLKDALAQYLAALDPTLTPKPELPKKPLFKTKRNIERWSDEAERILADYEKKVGERKAERDKYAKAVDAGYHMSASERQAQDEVKCDENFSYGEAMDIYEGGHKNDEAGL